MPTSSAVSNTLPGAYLEKSCVLLGNCRLTPCLETTMRPSGFLAIAISGIRAEPMKIAVGMITPIFLRFITMVWLKLKTENKMLSGDLVRFRVFGTAAARAEWSNERGHDWTTIETTEKHYSRDMIGPDISVL